MRVLSVTSAKQAIAPLILPSSWLRAPHVDGAEPHAAAVGQFQSHFRFGVLAACAARLPRSGTESGMSTTVPSTAEAITGASG